MALIHSFIQQRLPEGLTAQRAVLGSGDGKESMTGEAPAS